MEVYIILCTFVASLLTYYFYNRNIRRYTDQEGVLYLGSLYGNMVKTVLKGEHLTDGVLQQYNRVKQAKQKFGIESEFGRPAFFITDLELIKLVLIKHFDHFANPFKLSTLTNDDDLVGRMVISLRGEKWKAFRSKILNPIFSNAKLKRVFHLMDQSGLKLVNYLKLETQKGDGVVDLEIGLSKFTMDLITSSALAVDTKIFEEKVKPTLLDKMIAKISFGSKRMIFQMMLVSIAPFISDLLNYSIIDVKVQQFFRRMMQNTIREREKNRQRDSSDFIELMLEARDEQLKIRKQNESKNVGIDTSTEIPLGESDIVAHSLTFFLAGYDTIRTALQLLSYNLALWPDVQNRLFEELKNAVTENDGELNYDIINKQEYLHCVISESLRLHSIGPLAWRVCTKDFLIPDTSIVIPNGSSIIIPVGAIQTDPEYFPNPEVFDPERFSAKNHSKMHPCSYMPFGQGPRICAGMRLAQAQIKTAITYLLLNFSLEPCEKTQIPLKLASTSMTTQPANGLWLKLKQRT